MVKLGVPKEFSVYTAESTYVNLFSKIFQVKQKAKIQTFKACSRLPFDTNFVNQNNRDRKVSSPAVQFISALKDLPCIGDDGNSLQSSVAALTKSDFHHISRPLISPKGYLSGRRIMDDLF